MEKDSGQKEIRGRKSEIRRLKTDDKGRREDGFGVRLQHIFEKLRRSEDLYFAI
jgi:hypothetical protein